MKDVGYGSNCIHCGKPEDKEMKVIKPINPDNPIIVELSNEEVILLLKGETIIKGNITVKTGKG